MAEHVRITADFKLCFSLVAALRAVSLGAGAGGPRCSAPRLMRSAGALTGAGEALKTSQGDAAAEERPPPLLRLFVLAIPAPPSSFPIIPVQMRRLPSKLKQPEYSAQPSSSLELRTGL